jgi:hypothetical protein
MSTVRTRYTRKATRAMNYAYSIGALKADEHARLAQPKKRVRDRSHGVRQTNPEARGSRCKNAPNEPSRRRIAGRKRDERTQRPPTSTAERCSTKRTQHRKPLDRTRRLEMGSGDNCFLRNEPMSRSRGGIATSSRHGRMPNEPNGKAIRLCRFSGTYRSRRVRIMGCADPRTRCPFVNAAVKNGAPKGDDLSIN